MSACRWKYHAMTLLAKILMIYGIFRTVKICWKSLKSTKTYCNHFHISAKSTSPRMAWPTTSHFWTTPMSKRPVLRKHHPVHPSNLAAANLCRNITLGQESHLPRGNLRFYKQCVNHLIWSEFQIPQSYQEFWAAVRFLPTVDTSW